ncbi:unnamed protein product, partial [Allacma fusca]
YRKLRGGGKPLVLSLASGDLLMSILHVLPAISSFYQKWVFGSLGCNLYAAVVGLCGIASLLTLSAIAANRFSNIVGRPLFWLDGNKPCFFIWILSGSLTFPPLFGWSQFGTEGMGTSCTWDYHSRDFYNRLYYIFLLTFGFVLPVSTIIISYIGILWAVCRHTSSNRVLLEDGRASQAGRATINDLKTAKVTFAIIICFLTAWGPYALVSLIGQFGGEGSQVSRLGTALPGIFAKTSVIFNPFVYALSHPNFRSALRRLRAQQSRKKFRMTNNTAMNNPATAMNNLNTALNNMNTVLHNSPDHNANKYGNHHQFRSVEKGNNVEKAIDNGKRDSPLNNIPQPTDSMNVTSPREHNPDNIKPLVYGTSIFPRHLLFFSKSSFEDLQVAMEIEGEKRVLETNVRGLDHPESYDSSYYHPGGILAPRHRSFHCVGNLIDGASAKLENLILDALDGRCIMMHQRAKLHEHRDNTLKANGLPFREWEEKKSCRERKEKLQEKKGKVIQGKAEHYGFLYLVLYRSGRTPEDSHRDCKFAAPAVALHTSSPSVVPLHRPSIPH